MASGVNFNYKVRTVNMHVYFNGKATDAMQRRQATSPSEEAAPSHIPHHFHGNTRDAEGFSTLLFTWAVVRMCFSPRFTSRVGCSPMERNIGDPLSTECARETFKKLFSSTLPTFQQATCIIGVLQLDIYIYKEDAWKDAVKYREPDKNIDSLIRLFHARVSRINQNLKKKYFWQRDESSVKRGE